MKKRSQLSQVVTDQGHAEFAERKRAKGVPARLPNPILTRNTPNQTRLQSPSPSRFPGQSIEWTKWASCARRGSRRLLSHRFDVRSATPSPESPYLIADSDMRKKPIAAGLTLVIVLAAGGYGVFLAPKQPTDTVYRRVKKPSRPRIWKRRTYARCSRKIPRLIEHCCKGEICAKGELREAMRRFNRIQDKGAIRMRRRGSFGRVASFTERTISSRAALSLRPG